MNRSFRILFFGYSEEPGYLCVISSLYNYKHKNIIICTSLLYESDADTAVNPS